MAPAAGSATPHLNLRTLVLPDQIIVSPMLTVPSEAGGMGRFSESEARLWLPSSRP